MTRYALLSDVGVERTNNEDSAAVDLELGLFVVADGMGGHAAGEVASRVAVDATLAALRSRPRPKRLRDEGEVMLQAMHDANSAVVREADERGTFGMGTTLSALFVRRRSAVIAHVGDSRIYSISKKGITQLTADHTLVAAMVEQGVITAEQAATHPDKHVLTQAIGTLGPLEPQVLHAKIPAKGRLLLCTDGLHDALTLGEIEALARGDDLDEAARALVDRANAAGGHDNVTVLLVEP
ncbi:MAG TPA: Stp1/IreP family PP2C-type Ser/Thr phosphatase [Myxococcota bacterium]|nr:Stp1/IreP family PP2C-type Ser/Thr phosphatase [Myxococcota bacterium]